MSTNFMCVFLQIICTTVVVALSILLGGGSLVCLSRGSWVQEEQTEEGNPSFGTEEDVTEVEPESQHLYEPVITSRDTNGGTFSSRNHV